MLPCYFGWVTCSEASLGSSSSRFDTTTIRQVSSGENPDGELKQLHYAGCGEDGSSLSGPIDRWRRKSAGWVDHDRPPGQPRMASRLPAYGYRDASCGESPVELCTGDVGALKYEGPCARAAAISSSCPGRAFRYTPTTDLHLPEDGEWQETAMSRDCPDQAIPIMDGMVLTAEKFSVVCFLC